jgi:fumarate hydratase subunit beta
MLNLSQISQKLPHRLKVPLSEEALIPLSIGDEVRLEGNLLAARDQAHRRLMELVEDGRDLPFEAKGQVIYYMGPSPARPGKAIGAAGPTTSGRMDHLTLPLLKLGIKALLGKGRRSQAVREGLIKYRAIYLAAVGGAGAFYGNLISSSKVLAWPELGPEALRILAVRDFPAYVVYDLSGGDLYSSGPAAFREELWP